MVWVIFRTALFLSIFINFIANYFLDLSYPVFYFFVTFGYTVLLVSGAWVVWFVLFIY